MTFPIEYDKGLVISLPVRDMQASIRWYKEAFGFEPEYVLDEMGWAELKTAIPKVSIGLSQVETPKIGEMSPVFGTTDIEAAYEHLKAMGVRFDGEIRTIPGMVKLLTAYDPDDNVLMLYQSLAS